MLGSRERRAARRGQQTEQSDGTDKATLEWLGAHIVKAKAETYRKHVLVDRLGPTPSDHKGAHAHTHTDTPRLTHSLYI